MNRTLIQLLVVVVAIVSILAFRPREVRADSITYTYTGNGAFFGTDFTYIAANGAVTSATTFTPTTSTDLLYLGRDLGPIQSVVMAIIVANEASITLDGTSGEVSESLSLQSVLNNGQTLTWTDSTDSTLTQQPTLTPEPSEGLMLAMALLTLTLVRRKAHC